MSSFVIKIIAAISMLIDHVGTLGNFPGWDICRSIGRISYPLYAFMIAEGYRHTRSKYKYLLSLLVCGVISFIPFGYFFYGEIFHLSYLNIMFTLATGLVAIIVSDKVMSGNLKMPVRIAVVFAVVVACSVFADYLSFDYGMWGVLLIVLYFFSDRKPLPLILSTLLFSFRKVIIQLVQGQSISNSSYRAIFSVLALIPLLLYNGSKGYTPKSKGGRIALKYGFYLFYPLHIALLILVRYLFL